MLKSTSKIVLGNKNLLSVLMVFSIFVASAQKKYERRNPVKLGGAMELVSPGNCHGGMFSPLLSLNKGKHSVFGAALWQKRDAEFVGGRLGYAINLTEGCPRKAFFDDEEEEGLPVNQISEVAERSIFYISAFSSVSYVHQTLLSKSAVQIETRTERDKGKTSWGSYRMSTIEIAAGVELNFRFTKRVTWKNRVGISVYDHLDYNLPMYNSKTAPTLLLATGIHICPL